MSAARDRLSSGYYNNLPVSVGNPGGMLNSGHETNFPAALDDMATVADEAAVSADAAEGSAGAAAASAASAVNAPGTTATSLSTVSIPTSGATRTFMVQPGKTIVYGMNLHAAVVGFPDVWVAGSTLAYDAVTGQLDLDVKTFRGSGSYSNWSLSVTAPPVNLTPSDIGAASHSDLTRVLMMLAELQGNQFGTANGVADAFEDTDGVDAGASSNAFYDPVNDNYANTAPAGDAWVKNVAGSVDIGNDDLRGLATNGAFYIVVGLNGRILKSTGMDTSDWTVKVSGLGALQDCIYSARLGLFIVTGAGGLIRTSPDGDTWTAQTSGVATQLNGLCETTTHLVVVGASGVILTSTNAIAWTAQTSGTTDDLRSVAHGAGATVAATVTSGRVHRSTNLTVWASVNMPTTGEATATCAHNLVFNGAYFLTVISGRWRKSVDGAAWTEGVSVLTMAGVYGLFWTGVRWVVSGTIGGLNGNCAVSVDGETWAATTHDGGGSGGPYATSFILLGTTIISAGNGGYIFSSTAPLAAMDLRSVAVTAAAVPGKASLVAVAFGGSPITPGTHLTGYVTRDNGGAWLAMTLIARETLASGHTVFEAFGASLASLPSGVAMRWRFVTTGGFSVAITAVHLSWS